MENEKIISENIPVSDEEIKEVSGGVRIATPVTEYSFRCPVCNKEVGNAFKITYRNCEMCIHCKSKLAGQ